MLAVLQFVTAVGLKGVQHDHCTWNGNRTLNIWVSSILDHRDIYSWTLSATFWSEINVISVCSVIIVGLSSKWSLARGLLSKISRTGAGTFCSSGILVSSVGVLWWWLVGVWPSTFAREGDILFLRSGVSVIASTAGSPFCPSISSGLKELLTNDRFQFSAFIICLEAWRSPHNLVLLRRLDD